VQLAVLVPSQRAPQVVPAPLPPHAERAPCGMPSTAVHLPTLPPTSQAWHCPPHALSQHTPSTQLPEPHSALDAQGVALALVQCPGAVGRLHEKPVPVQAASQHVPPTQNPLWQATLALQTLPLATLAWQVFPGAQ
jgi:hypothetical protein